LIIDEYSSPKPYPELQIHTSVLSNNLKVIRNIIPKKTKILIPVKANAYGFGIKTLLPFFERADVDYLGVANPWEGRILRKMGCKKPILNLGSFHLENVELLLENNIITSITNINQIEILNKVSKEKKIITSVHIKLDLGMGRLGILTNEVSTLIKKLLKSEYLNVSGIFTHFPNADIRKSKSTKKQIKLFQEITNRIITELKLKEEEVLLHTANSYAILNYPQSHFDMVRPGLIFYGYFQNERDLIQYKKQHQKEKNNKNEITILPALTLKAKPISLRNLKEGQTISYGSNYIVKKKNLYVGVLPLGYGDGLPRALANQKKKLKMKFEGHQLLGNVTMDQIILKDVTSDKYIEIIGENSPPLERWADLSNTITYEILTGLGSRLRRKLIAIL